MAAAGREGRRGLVWDEAGERKHRSSLGLERAGERHCGQKDLPGITRGTKWTLWGQMEVRSGEFGAKSEFIYQEISRGYF